MHEAPAGCADPIMLDQYPPLPTQPARMVTGSQVFKAKTMRQYCPEEMLSFCVISRGKRLHIKWGWQCHLENRSSRPSTCTVSIREAVSDSGQAPGAHPDLSRAVICQVGLLGLGREPPTFS